jgi:hypothetical protein|tara:strand:+ start:506 stop:1231 length:726 start_codon:yes stop_codon:yes gene_type:complete
MAGASHLRLITHSPEENPDWNLIDSELIFASFFSPTANPQIQSIAPNGEYDGRMKAEHKRKIAGARSYDPSTIVEYACAFLDMSEEGCIDFATRVAMLDSEPEDVAAMSIITIIPKVRETIGIAIRDSSNIPLDMSSFNSSEDKTSLLVGVQYRLCPFTEYRRSLYEPIAQSIGPLVLNARIDKQEERFANLLFEERKPLLEEFFSLSHRAPLTMLGIANHIDSTYIHTLQNPEFYYGGRA